MGRARAEIVTYDPRFHIFYMAEVVRAPAYFVGSLLGPILIDSDAFVDKEMD